MNEIDDAIGRIESLIQSLETLPDDTARQTATALVQSLMDIHAAAFERMLQMGGSESFVRRAAQDDLIRSLLLLYGLHPDDVQTRVRQALEKVRPYLRSHGGDVDLVAVEEDTVRLRLSGSCQGCPSSSRTLKLAVEDAIFEMAPEIVEIVADDRTAGGSRGRWEDVAGTNAVAAGRGTVLEVGGNRLLFCRVGDALYAWGSQCPACASSLEGAPIDGSELRCPNCARRFDVFAAGRETATSEFHLDPFPLLVENGRARVALP